MKYTIQDQAGKVLHSGFLLPNNKGIKIGSGEKCDVQLKRLGISREHLLIQMNSDGVVSVQDLQSPFGTWVGNRKLQPGFLARVEPGEKVRLSDSIQLLLAVPTAEEAPTEEESAKAEMATTIFPFFLHRNQQMIHRTFMDLLPNLPERVRPQFREAEEKVMTKVRELSAILEVTYALNSIFSFQRLLEFTLEMAITVTGADRGFIMLHNEELDRLETVVLRRLHPRQIERDLLATSGFVLQCFRSGKTFIGHPPVPESGAGGAKSSLLQEGIKAVAVTPLRNEQTLIGILYLDSKQSDSLFNEQTKETLALFAAQASVAIHRARLFHLATTDNLTGTSNQKHFHQRLLEEFCRANRHGKPLSLIMMDIDRFGAVNEKYGESVGDQVLKGLARVFRSGMRVHDLVARLGSDEFALILPETAAEGALTVAEKLRLLIEKTSLRAGKKTVRVTGSLGVACSLPGMNKPMDLVSSADKALAKARKNGGNQIAVAPEPKA